MTSSANERCHRIVLWITIQFAVASAYTPHDCTSRGMRSFLKVPIKYIGDDITTNQRYVFLSAFVAALVSTAAAAKASELVPKVNESSTSNPIAVGILSAGYKLEAGQYHNFVTSLSPLKLTVLASGDDADSTIESLTRDAEGVLSEVKLLRYNGGEKDAISVTPLVLMGHSRGGSVATLAATACLKAAVSRSGLDGAYKDEMRVLLVLLDPVDTADNIAINAVHDCLEVIGTATAREKKSMIPKDHLPIIWPWPVLIISTPYGGSSSYYKVPYESACAPLMRNGDAFIRQFSRQNMALSDSPSTVVGGTVRVTEDSETLKESCKRILHLTLPDVGHTQLLDNRRNSTIGSICAGNEKISDKDVRGLMQTLITTWTASTLNSKINEDSHTLMMSDIKNTLSKAYPNIKTIWSQ